MKQKRIIGRENAVEAIAVLCRDYRGTALRAIRQGGESVYVPADPRDPNAMLEMLRDPGVIFDAVSQGNASHGEPCYASINEFLDGRNSDGTQHKGYLEVDVVGKAIIDFADRDGNSVVPAPEVKPFNPSLLRQELTGKYLESRTLPTNVLNSRILIGRKLG